VVVNFIGGENPQGHFWDKEKLPYKTDHLLKKRFLSHAMFYDQTRKDDLYIVNTGDCLLEI
jgi:hypothetical protein